MPLAFLSDMTNELLTQIRILEAERILNYEWFDGHLETAGISSEGTVRHPLLVMDREDGSYLLLDDSHQYEAFLAAGLQHIPAQVCGRRSVRLAVQKAGLVNFGLDDLNRLITRFPDQFAIGTPEKKRPADYLQLEVSFNYREPFSLYLRHSTKVGCPAPLVQLFEAILQKGRYVPVMEGRNWKDSVCRTVTHSGILTLPEFTVEDLEAAAISDRLFPPNIIKAGSNMRILNIDFPVSVLQDGISAQEKEAFLRELIMVREQAYRTNFFEGSVYILNR